MDGDEAEPGPGPASNFMRNLRFRVPRSVQQMVAALVHTIFAQPDTVARVLPADAAESLTRRFPKSERMLRDAEEDILAYMALSNEHWR